MSASRGRTSLATELDDLDARGSAGSHGEGADPHAVGDGRDTLLGTRASRTSRASWRAHRPAFRVVRTGAARRRDLSRLVRRTTAERDVGRFRGRSPGEYRLLFELSKADPGRVWARCRAPSPTAFAFSSHASTDRPLAQAASAIHAGQAAESRSSGSCAGRRAPSGVERPPARRRERVLVPARRRCCRREARVVLEHLEHAGVDVDIVFGLESSSDA